MRIARTTKKLTLDLMEEILKDTTASFDERLDLIMTLTTEYPIGTEFKIPLTEAELFDATRHDGESPDYWLWFQLYVYQLPVPDDSLELIARGQPRETPIPF